MAAVGFAAASSSSSSSGNSALLMDDSSSSSSSMMCESYNPKECDPAITSCQQYVECKKTPSMLDACYSVWSNDTVGGIKIKLKGCWLGQAGSHNNCDQERCVTDKPTSTTMLADGQEHTTYYCCCSKARCNEQVEFVHAPAIVQRVTNDPPESRSSEIDWVTAAVSSLVPIFAVAAIMLVLYYVYRRYSLCTKFKRMSASSDGDNLMMYKSPSSPMVALKSIQPDQIIARGRYGTVWRAQMGADQTVAVKQFPAQEVESWKQEQSIYSTPGFRDNPNILRFYGAEVRGGGPSVEYWLITAYQENGSVNDYLKTHILTLPEFLQIAMGITNGLAYLHEERNISGGSSGSGQEQMTSFYKPTVVHRDFKSRNVLLGRDLTPVISDFGLALRCVNGRQTNGIQNQVGTRRYMAPEVLQGATDMNSIAFVYIDIYAAGLVLWELFSRCRLIDGAKVADYKLPYDEVGPRPTLQDLQGHVVDNKRRPKIEDEWIRHPQGAVICKTIEEMWDMEPEARVLAGLAYERFASQRAAILVAQQQDPTSSSSATVPLASGAHSAGGLIEERSPLISELPETILPRLDNDMALVV